jgi:hypothetical protein
LLLYVEADSSCNALRNYALIRPLIILGVSLKASHLVKFIFVAAFTALSFVNQASAKDLTNRLGVGFKNGLGIDLPSISAQYYPNPDFGVTGALGLDTEENQSKFGFQVGLRKIIFKEDNMNFYMGAAVALLSQEVATKTESGFEMNGHVGGEFFLAGLDSLGFNFESGIAVTSMKTVRFRTMADHPFRAGIVFYF